MTVTKIKQGR